jgi:hypothetical protein
MLTQIKSLFGLSDAAEESGIVFASKSSAGFFQEYNSLL